MACRWISRARACSCSALSLCSFTSSASSSMIISISSAWLGPPSSPTAPVGPAPVSSMTMLAIRFSAMDIDCSFSTLAGGGNSNSMSFWVNSIVSTTTKSCQSIAAMALCSSSNCLASSSSLCLFPRSHSARFRASSSVFHFARGSAASLTRCSSRPGGGCMTFWYDSTMRL